MGDGSDKRGGNGNGDYIAARFFDQKVDEWIEKPNIRHHGKVNDRKNEQDRNRHGNGHARLDEFSDFLKRSARRHGGDNRRNDEDRRRSGFGLQQTINNDCHHEKPDDCQHVSSPSYSKVQDYCSHPFYNILIFWNNTLLLLLSITKTDGSHLFQAIRKKKKPDDRHINIRRMSGLTLCALSVFKTVLQELLR